MLILFYVYKLCFCLFVLWFNSVDMSCRDGAITSQVLTSNMRSYCVLLKGTIRHQSELNSRPLDPKSELHIRKTCPCNVYTLEPHFYIVKLGYAGVYLFFLFLLQNIDCGYSLEPPRRGGSNVYPQSMF